MMLLTLALLAQNADLPANTVEAARLCAVSAHSWEGSPIEASARLGYFTLAATRETRGNKLVADHIGDEAAIVADLAKTAKPVPLDICRKRFPLAFAARVTLPADSFERRLACVMASGFVMGLTEDVNDPEVSRRYKALFERFIRLVGDDEFARHGVTGEAQTRTLADRYLGGIVDLGSPLAIVTTCEAAFPA